MFDADTIRMNGRTYISIRAAVRLVSYSRSYLYFCCRQRKLQVIRGPDGRIYVNRADLLRFVEQKNRRQSKWQQIAAWWRDHPRERAAIQSGKQFQRVLAQAGIRCSPAWLRAWLARHAPRRHPVDTVLAWLEADAERRKLPIAQARRELLTQVRLKVCPKTIRLAWKRYDAARPPFDPAQYQAIRDAALQLGISRELIGHHVRCGKLNGIHWKDTLYVRRADMQQRFGTHWIKRNQRQARLRAWYLAHPAYLNLKLVEAQRAFFVETGIRLSASLFSRVRKWAKERG